MQNYEHQPKSEELAPNPVRYLGAGLIAAGVVIALYIATQLLSLYHGLDANPFVADLIRRLGGAVLVADGSHNIVIGEGGASIAAVVAFAILTWAGAGIAYSLIRAGSLLITPFGQTQLTRLKLKVDQLKQALANKPGPRDFE